jgi:hypothetical protein
VAVAALSLATDPQRVGGLLLCFDVEQRFDPGDPAVPQHGARALVTPALHKGIAYQAQRSTAQQLQHKS